MSCNRYSMAKYVKIILFIAFLLIKHISIAQTLSLGEITAKADKLIGEYKDKEALEILENVDIDIYKNEDEVKLASFYFVKATAYDLNEDSSNSVKSFEKACDYYEKAGITYDRYLQSLQSLGRLYYTLGDVRLSENYFKKVILYGYPTLIFTNEKLREKDAVKQAFLNLGILYVNSNKVDLAEKCLHNLQQLEETDKANDDKQTNVLYKYIIDNKRN